MSISAKHQPQSIRAAVAEVGMIVVGVLIAIAANGCWEGRQDRERETIYLRQLLADTRTNEKNIGATIAVDSILRQRAIVMLQIFRSRAPLPPIDSLALVNSWGEHSGDLYIAAGTYELMLRTNDFRLLRNDSIRAALIDLDSKIRGVVGPMESNAERHQNLNAVRTERMVLYLPRSNAVTRSVGTSNDWIRDIDWEKYRTDPTAESAYQLFIYLQNNNISSLRQLLTATQRLRRHLEVNIHP